MFQVLIELTVIVQREFRSPTELLPFSVCRLMVTEFLEQMKKTDRREDVPRGYALEDLENPDKSIHYEKS